jgi:hypothetical protein
MEKRFSGPELDFRRLQFAGHVNWPLFRWME